MIYTLILSHFLKGDVLLRELGPADAPLVCELHKTGFTPAWSLEDMLDLLRHDNVFGYLAFDSKGKAIKKNLGFILARIASDEAEILTIAVRPRARNRGLGHKLLDAVLRKLYAERIKKLLLEVDETNLPALRLYERMGFKTVGERKGYYHSQDGAVSSALVMQRIIR